MYLKKKNRANLYAPDRGRRPRRIGEAMHPVDRTRRFHRRPNTNAAVTCEAWLLVFFSRALGAFLACTVRGSAKLQHHTRGLLAARQPRFLMTCTSTIDRAASSDPVGWGWPHCQKLTMMHLVGGRRSRHGSWLSTYISKEHRDLLSVLVCIRLISLIQLSFNLTNYTGTNRTF